MTSSRNSSQRPLAVASSVITLPVYENLAIEGGGVLGIAYVGALKALYDDKSVFAIKSFSGSSVGAIIALMLAVRIDYDTLHRTVFNMDLRSFKDSGWIARGLIRIVQAFGFYAGDALHDFILKTVRLVTGLSDPTFADVLRVFGTKLIVTGTNVSKCCCEYFSVDTTPDMSVALACRISASIPYFYEAVLWRGCYYIDGGCLDNYPIGVFSSEKTIGLKLISDSDVDVPKFSNVDNILEFTSRIAMCVHAQALRVHVRSDDFVRTVKINCGNVSFINFNLTAADKQKLIDCGASAMQKFRDDSAQIV